MVVVVCGWVWRLPAIAHEKKEKKNPVGMVVWLD